MHRQYPQAQTAAPPPQPRRLKQAWDGRGQHLIVHSEGAKGIQAVCAARSAYHIVAAASNALLPSLHGIAVKYEQCQFLKTDQITKYWISRLQNANSAYS